MKKLLTRPVAVWKMVLLAVVSAQVVFALTRTLPYTLDCFKQGIWHYDFVQPGIVSCLRFTVEAFWFFLVQQ